MNVCLNIPKPNNFILQNFLFIDSDNYKDIKTKFYGFYTGDNELNINVSNGALLDKSKGGCFMNVINDGKKVIIQQDFFGSYGLFLFQKDNYFAISNSSLLLIYHIKDRYKLTINKDFVDFISSTREYMPYAFESTYINEIKQLPPNCNIEISLNDGKLSVEKPIYNLCYTSLDSPEAFKIIDDWHDKYHRILSHLTRRKKFVEMHLT